MGMRGLLMQIAPQRLEDLKKNPKLARDQVLEMASVAEGYESYSADSESLQFQDQTAVVQKAIQDFDVEAYRKNALSAMQLQNSRRPDPFPQEVLEKSINRIVDVMRAKRDLWQGTPEEVRAKRMANINADRFSLEKDWHVLHYALNATSEAGSGPLERTILGGSELRCGRQEYGPLRYLTTEQVRETATALAKVDAKKLLDKLDADDALAKQIYLAETLSDLESWSYLPELFEKLRKFYRDAAEKGNAMLLKIL